jgi:small subunit ribosomal protein S21
LCSFSETRAGRVDKFRSLWGLPTICAGPFRFPRLVDSRSVPDVISVPTAIRHNEIALPEIILQDTDRIDWALKTFKRQMQKSGILREIRRRRHYVKPSEARQAKSKAAQRSKRSAARRQARKTNF